MWKRIHYDVAHLQQVFDTLDVNNNGYIDVSSVTSMVGLDFEGEDISAMISEADLNGDGKEFYSKRTCANTHTYAHTHNHTHNHTTIHLNSSTNSHMRTNLQARMRLSHLHTRTLACQSQS